MFWVHGGKLRHGGETHGLFFLHWSCFFKGFDTLWALLNPNWLRLLLRFKSCVDKSHNLERWNLIHKAHSTINTDYWWTLNDSGQCQRNLTDNSLPWPLFDQQHKLIQIFLFGNEFHVSGNTCLSQRPWLHVLLANFWQKREVDYNTCRCQVLSTITTSICSETEKINFQNNEWKASVQHIRS